MCTNVWRDYKNNTNNSCLLSNSTEIKAEIIHIESYKFVRTHGIIPGVLYVYWIQNRHSMRCESSQTVINKISIKTFINHKLCTHFKIIETINCFNFIISDLYSCWIDLKFFHQDGKLRRLTQGKIYQNTRAKHCIFKNKKVISKHEHFTTRQNFL